MVHEVARDHFSHGEVILDEEDPCRLIGRALITSQAPEFVAVERACFAIHRDNTHMGCTLDYLEPYSLSPSSGAQAGVSRWILVADPTHPSRRPPGCVLADLPNGPLPTNRDEVIAETWIPWSEDERTSGWSGTEIQDEAGHGPRRQATAKPP